METRLELRWGNNYLIDVSAPYITGHYTFIPWWLPFKTLTCFDIKQQIKSVFFQFEIFINGLPFFCFIWIPNSVPWNICITIIQHRPNFFDVGPTLYKCYTNVSSLLGKAIIMFTPSERRKTLDVIIWCLYRYQILTSKSRSPLWKG